MANKENKLCIVYNNITKRNNIMYLTTKQDNLINRMLLPS